MAWALLPLRVNQARLWKLVHVFLAPEKANKCRALLLLWVLTLLSSGGQTPSLPENSLLHLTSNCSSSFCCWAVRCFCWEATLWGETRSCWEWQIVCDFCPALDSASMAFGLSSSSADTVRAKLAPSKYLEGWNGTMFLFQVTVLVEQLMSNDVHTQDEVISQFRVVKDCGVNWSWSLLRRRELWERYVT